jgi:hypothetical protein
MKIPFRNDLIDADEYALPNVSATSIDPLNHRFKFEYFDLLHVNLSDPMKSGVALISLSDPTSVVHLSIAVIQNHHRQNRNSISQKHRLLVTSRK